jgi:hypothetical protein
MNAAGDAVVAFASTSTTTAPEVYPFTMQAVRYDSATQDYIRQTGSIVIKDLESNVIPVDYARPQVALDVQGDCIIMWDNYITSTNWYINAAHYSYTTTWTAWVPSVTVVTQGFVMLPTVAMDSLGNAMGLWMIYVPPYGALILQAAAYDKESSSWGTASYVCTDFDHDINFFTTTDDWPSVVYDSDGTAWATWCQSDGRVARVQNSHFINVAARSESLFGQENIGERIRARRAVQARNHLAVKLEKSNMARGQV